jgi:hypothetical protein
MKRETLKVYVGTLRSRVVTLFAARGDMRDGGHRRQESLLSWISTFTGLLLVCNGISEPSLRQIRPVGIQFVSGILNLRKGAASVTLAVLVLMMMNFCVGLHIHLT